MISFLEKYILKKFNTISFDIFDTLIERDVDIPSDIFYYASIDILGEKSAEKFRNDRINAEIKARESKCNGEVNLNDIYSNLPEEYNVPKEELIKAEIETEIAMCHAKEKVSLFLNKMIKNNKTVILISDMYLSKMVIKRMLDKCNIRGYKNIYISNEFGTNKISGGLFLKVIDMENINVNEYLHVGDSIKADLIGAYKVGVCSLPVRRKSRFARLFYK